MYNYIIQAKLWNKVKFPEEPARFYLDCWVWTGQLGTGGHGHFSHRGKTYLAHRVAYAVAAGEDIPEGLVVRHQVCNNPPCCNPLHLKTGTHLDNVADRIAARRSATGARNGNHTHPEQRRVGEKHGMSKIKEDDVRLLRAVYRVFSDYGFGRFWSRRLDIPVSHVMRIANGVSWCHVITPADFPIPPGFIDEMKSEIEGYKSERLEKWKQARQGQPIHTSKLTEEQVVAMRQKKSELREISYRQLGLEFGVSGNSARDIVTRKSWAHIP